MNTKSFDINEILNLVNKIDIEKLQSMEGTSQKAKEIEKALKELLTTSTDKGEELRKRIAAIEIVSNKLESDVSGANKNLKSLMDKAGVLVDLDKRTEEANENIKNIMNKINAKEKEIDSKLLNITTMQKKLSLYEETAKVKEASIDKKLKELSVVTDKYLVYGKNGKLYAKNTEDKFFELSPHIDMVAKKEFMFLDKSESIITLAEEYAPGYAHTQVYVDGVLTEWEEFAPNKLKILALKKRAKVIVFYIPKLSVATRGSEGEVFKIKSLSATDVGLGRVDNVNYEDRKLNKNMKKEIKSIIEGWKK
jgi:hypothetical protein